MADKAGVTGIGGAKVTWVSVTCLTLPHLHGALTVTGKPVFPEYRRILRSRHISVAQAAKFFFRILMAGVTGGKRVIGVAEVDVVRLLLIDAPLHFLVLANVVVDVVSFGLAASEDLRVTNGAVLCVRNSGKGSVRAEVMAIRTIQRGISQMLIVTELHGLLLFAEHKLWKNPPAKHERNDKTHEKRCETDPVAFCPLVFLRVGGRVVLPVLHTLRLLQ